MKKNLFFLVALMLSTIGLWAAPEVGNTFDDAASGLKFEITAIGDNNAVKVIRGDYSASSYTIPASVTYDDVTFTVTAIGKSAFYSCSAVTTINFAENSQLNNIEDWAFAECGLTSFTFPASLATISDYVFWGSLAMYDVYVPWTDANDLPTLGGTDLFYEIANHAGPSGATLHVPAGTKAIYEAANVWKDFGTIDAPVMGVTVNVTVPEGTPACYFYGAMSDNQFVEMTKVDDTHYTTTFATATEIGWGYKFVWESGNWDTENSDPNGDIKVEPTDGVINVEVKAWKTAPTSALPSVSNESKDGKAIKMMHNGQLYILKEDKTYSVLGQEVR